MHIYHSPFSEIEIPELSATQWVFQGLAQNEDRPFLTDTTTGRSLTGAQAMHDIRALAGGLIARGFRKGQVVAIMAPNIPEYFTVFHAVAFAGGSVTMVNPSYTAAELHHQLRAVDAHLLVTVPELAGLAREAVADTHVADIVTVGDAPDGTRPLTDLIGDPLEQQVSVDLANDILVLPFSSGTTGLPKGVMLSHQNLVTNACQWSISKRIGTKDVTVSFLPFFHIFGLAVSIMVFPGSGASLHTMHRFDLDKFLKLAQDIKAQRLWVVPPIAIALAKSPVVDGYDLSALKAVYSGAAPLSVEIGRAVAKRIGCEFSQGYGMTEMSGTCHVMPDAVRDDTLGVLVPNTEGRIVDPETGIDQGPDGHGEIWLKGAQVMMGYLNDPDETAKVLDADGWFRTGDIGSIDAHGYLRIHDRLKEMIKVKGFAVAPAEIEAVLITHPNILDAAVIGVPDDDLGEAPVAFIVPTAENAPDLATLQEFVSQHLARYKNITAVNVVDTIPKSPSGKILRRVLRG